LLKGKASINGIACGILLNSNIYIWYALQNCKEYETFKEVVIEIKTYRDNQQQKVTLISDCLLHKIEIKGAENNE
jgi:hypothetical protein